MKTELKTLKDIQPLVRCLTCDKVMPNLVHKMHLKQEAIKWFYYKFGSNLYEDKQVAIWIKYFFNISEEELTSEETEVTEEDLK